MKRFDFLQSLIVVSLITLAVVAIASVDRLAELREIREITRPNVCGQYRVFVAGNQ